MTKVTQLDWSKLKPLTPEPASPKTAGVFLTAEMYQKRLRPKQGTNVIPY